MAPMKLAKISIAVTAAVYLIIGIMFLTAPVYWAEGVDITLPTPTAVIDLQATYGGCMAGLGVFFLYCLRNEASIRTGLVLQALTLGGFALSRVLGIVLYGRPEPLIYYLLVSEAGGVLLALYCLRRTAKTDRI